MCEQDRAAIDQFQDPNYTVKWRVDNEMDIVVVVRARSSLHNADPFASSAP